MPARVLPPVARRLRNAKADSSSCVNKRDFLGAAALDLINAHEVDDDMCVVEIAKAAAQSAKQGEVRSKFTLECNVSDLFQIQRRLSMNLVYLNRTLRYWNLGAVIIRQTGSSSR